MEVHKRYIETRNYDKSKYQIPILSLEFVIDPINTTRRNLTKALQS